MFTIDFEQKIINEIETKKLSYEDLFQLAYESYVDFQTLENILCRIYKKEVI